MAEFNIDRFLDLAGAVKVDDLDWQLCREVGLTDIEARILRYMADTESHTILYMRDLLAGHSTKDPEIVAFLSAWVYEELCHGRAISRLLAECGYPEDVNHYTTVTTGASVRESIEAALTHLVYYMTPRMVAVHMTWGAINEATAAVAYQALEQRTANPVLKILVNRMARQERRHMSFYWHQAEKRLRGEPRTQKLVNFAIKRFWSLVGGGVAGTENLEFVAAHLFPDADSRQALVKCEETIRELPGLEWFKSATLQTQERAEAYISRHGPCVYTTQTERAAEAIARIAS
ncbi:MAG: hypothetical protein EXR76_20285 [Myxococcales bacterium]|nr:hypothetical protein [Myxococcales bacterium]